MKHVAKFFFGCVFCAAFVLAVIFAPDFSELSGIRPVLFSIGAALLGAISLGFFADFNECRKKTHRGK